MRKEIGSVLEIMLFPDLFYEFMSKWRSKSRKPQISDSIVCITEWQETAEEVDVKAKSAHRYYFFLFES